LNYYLEKREFDTLITNMKNLSKKKQQSGFVILGMIKYSLKLFLPKIINEDNIQNKYLDSIKNIFQFIKNNDDSNFDLLKINLMKAIDIKNWDEIQHLIFNFEYGPEDKIVIDKHNKKICLGDTADFNTESSTKLDNKLELSMNKEVVSSTRNLKVISSSPMSINNVVIKTDSSQKLKVLSSDSLKFVKINKKLPYLSLAVDITMSAAQIKKLFISEMTL
jgi:hypothetical protein